MIIKKIKRKIIHLYESRELRKYVQVYDNCTINQSTFEGKNTVNSNSSVLNSSIGLCTYIGDGSYISHTKIGRFCSIAENVRIAIGNHPTSVFVSTFPSFYYNTESQIGFTFHEGNAIFDGIKRFPEGENDFQVVIGHDVWIGCNSLIRGGVKIGNGSVIGAGAVVTRDVPPYSIVAGVPAKVIKYRFTREQIDFLEKIQWWNWPMEKIQKDYMFFSNIEDFIKQFKDSNEY